MITNITETNNTDNSLFDSEPNASYSGMNEIFAETKQIIAEMQNGERIGMKDLADKVAFKVNKSTSKVMGLVQIFCKDSKDVTVEVGRSGGVFKGGKQKKVDSRPRCHACNQVVRHDLTHKINH